MVIIYTNARTLHAKVSQHETFLRAGIFYRGGGKCLFTDLVSFKGTVPDFVVLSQLKVMKTCSDCSKRK